MCNYGSFSTVISFVFVSNYVLTVVPVWSLLNWMKKQEERSWLHHLRSSEGPTQLATESKDMAAVDWWSSGRCCIVSSAVKSIDDTDSRSCDVDVHSADVKNETPIDLAYLWCNITNSTRPVSAACM